MTADSFGDVIAALAREAHAAPGLRVLLVFGSRARGESSPRSDWDLGYLGVPELDPAVLRARLVEAIGTDRIDLVDLDRASGLLRYRAARDGQLIFEAERDLADRFRLDAAQFWCDAAPLLERGYEDVLRELSR